MEPPLTNRELYVVRLASLGKTDKEIARASNLRVTTIRTYWDRIRRKTGTLSRTHAVCVALGVVDSPARSLDCPALESRE